MACSQVFPIEFHIPTLTSWLQHTSWLAAGADVKALLSTMMARLASGGADADAAGSDGEGDTSKQPFALLIAASLAAAMQLAVAMGPRGERRARRPR